MSKKKIYTCFWVFVNLICWGTAALLVRDIATKIKEIKEGPKIHYVARKIPITHTKYGDYLVGLMAKQKHDYAMMITAFESALRQDPENLKLKKNVYLLKAIRGDIDDVLPLAQDLNALRQAELLTDYVLISNKIKQKSYEEAAQILSEKPRYGSDSILKPALNAWIAAGLNKRADAEKFLAELNNPKSESLYHYYMALMALAFQDTAAAEKSFQKMSTLSDKGYPSLTAIVFLRDFYAGKDNWKPGMPEYDRYQALLNASLSV